MTGSRPWRAAGVRTTSQRAAPTRLKNRRTDSPAICGAWKVEDLPAAIGRALGALREGHPALLDVLVSPGAASSGANAGLACVPELKALGAWDDAERQWRRS